MHMVKSDKKEEDVSNMYLDGFISGESHNPSDALRYGFLTDDSKTFDVPSTLKVSTRKCPPHARC